MGGRGRRVDGGPRGLAAGRAPDRRGAGRVRVGRGPAGVTGVLRSGRPASVISSSSVGRDGGRRNMAVSFRAQVRTSPRFACVTRTEFRGAWVRVGRVRPGGSAGHRTVAVGVGFRVRVARGGLDEVARPRALALVRADTQRGPGGARAGRFRRRASRAAASPRAGAPPPPPGRPRPGPGRGGGPLDLPACEPPPDRVRARVAGLPLDGAA